MKVLVFTGAGASVELGVPAMGQLAAEFRRHASDWSTHPDLLDALMGADEDIEDLIEKLDALCGATQPWQALGVTEESIRPALTLQAEIEWFVQHACERLTAASARQLWSACITACEQHELVIATTNYDRAIELAANTLDARLHDGFEQFGSSEIAHWVDFNSAVGFQGAGSITLLKLHGSTDWYELSSTGRPAKLRHPMPLFGRAVLSLPNVGDNLSVGMILPSREKRVTRPPYPRLSQVFLNSAEAAEVVVFVGSSFRDPHLKHVAHDVARTKPTFVVNPDLSRAAAPIGGYAIAETASEFLVSTLPRALCSSNPVDVLKERADSSESPQSILPLIAAAANPALAELERCRAVEMLADRRIGLGFHVLAPLLADGSEMLARFALGLILDSPDRHLALEAATTAAQQNGSSEYAEELALLRQMTSAS